MWKITLALMTAATTGFSAVQTITPKDITDTTPPPQAQAAPTPSYMMITPAARAADLQQAFETLRKEKSTGKVFFQLADGSTIANVIDMTLMPNSTLILFRFNSNQGIRFQVVKVEEIHNISY